MKVVKKMKMHTAIVEADILASKVSIKAKMLYLYLSAAEGDNTSAHIDVAYFLELNQCNLKALKERIQELVTAGIVSISNETENSFDSSLIRIDQELKER